MLTDKYLGYPSINIMNLDLGTNTNNKSPKNNKKKDLELKDMFLKIHINTFNAIFDPIFNSCVGPFLCICKRFMPKQEDGMSRKCCGYKKINWDYTPC